MFSKEFKLSPKDWLIYEKGYNPKKVRIYESLFTLGNGYLGHRGSYEENPDEGDPATLIAGIFDKSENMVPQLVKAPSWVDLSVWVEGRRIDFKSCKILLHERILDMKKGILHRRARLRGPRGKIILIETKRVVFAHQVRGSAMEISITPENFSGEIRVISGLNGRVMNSGYYPGESVKHLNLDVMDRSSDHIYLEMKTRDKKIKIGLAASLVFKNPRIKYVKVNRMYGEKISEEIVFQAHKKNSYHFTKWISIYTSREGYEKQLKGATLATLQELKKDGLDYQLGQHVERRAKQWRRSDIVIKGDRAAQRAIRFDIYHLIIAKPHHDPTVSIGARLLTGEGYKGHAFWDTEIFILPFYIYNFPDEAANLLEYRYYTLSGARKNAKDLGYKGAKYAWESADDGIETTPKYGYEEDGTPVRIWTGDEEHHIVSDVVYAIYNYYNVTQDKEFLYKFGAEVVFETAKFWVSRVEKRRERYEIRKVIGPDEFHEHVDNNAFTNYLVGWHLQKAVELYREMKHSNAAGLKKLLRKLKLTDKNFEQMQIISKVIFLPYDQKTDLIEQFEGYFELEDIKVISWDKHGMPFYPKPKEELKLNKTQLVKQADVVLLMHLFPDRFSPELKKKNYKYYEARTMHKSSLSPCTYAMMGLEIGERKTAYRYFMKTAQIDLNNFAKNSSEGIHAAAMGGAWQTVVHGFAGMRVRRGTLCFDPWLPRRWQELFYRCRWHDGVVEVVITHKDIKLKYIPLGKRRQATVSVQGKSVEVKANKVKSIKYKPGRVRVC